jgi:hypothetical protein
VQGNFLFSAWKGFLNLYDADLGSAIREATKLLIMHILQLSANMPFYSILFYVFYIIQSLVGYTGYTGYLHRTE